MRFKKKKSGIFPSVCPSGIQSLFRPPVAWTAFLILGAQKDPHHHPLCLLVEEVGTHFAQSLFYWTLWIPVDIWTCEPHFGKSWSNLGSLSYLLAHPHGKFSCQILLNEYLFSSTPAPALNFIHITLPLALSILVFYLASLLLVFPHFNSSYISLPEIVNVPKIIPRFDPK